MLLGVRLFVQVVRDKPFPVGYLSRIFAEEITAPAVYVRKGDFIFIYNRTALLPVLTVRWIYPDDGFPSLRTYCLGPYN